MEVAKIQVSGTCAKTIYAIPITAGMIGAEVAVVYTDPVWDGLAKTVVFYGAGTKDVVTQDQFVTIPAEVIAQDHVRLQVGIYGTDAEGVLAIPTLWADLGTVKPGADPSGDTTTDPALPVWAQIQGMIGNLDDLETDLKNSLVAAVNEALRKGSALDAAAVRQIVTDYLAVNPPTVTESDPTVPAWAKQPTKPTYTAAEVGALSDETLPAAINTALAQAKDSGEFDGKDGDPGAPGADGYSPTASVMQTDTGAVITITDKTGTTTATLKNGADGQPGATGQTPNIQIGTVETLAAGSPATASMGGTPENPLLNLGIPQGASGSGGSGIVITGATVGQTVRIAAVDDGGVPTAWEPVDLPSGRGGGEWRLINTFTIETEDLAKVYFNTDLDGNPFELRELWIVGDGRNATTHSGSTNIAIYNRLGNGTTGDAAQYSYPIRFNSTDINYQRGFVTWFELLTETTYRAWSSSLGNTVSCSHPTLTAGFAYKEIDAIREIAIFPGYGSVLYGVGTVISIYGR